MSSEVLQLPIVLVLNRAWQAIHVLTVGKAVLQLAAGVVASLDVAPDGSMQPIPWDEWIHLPVRPGDRAIGTVRGAIRVPTVIICHTYDRVPTRRPKFSARAVRERDGGRCQYTGRVLGPGEGSLDHVLPLSRGGKTSFENVVWADRRVNHRKANRTPEEAGLRLLSRPRTPPLLPVTKLIRNTYGLTEWEPFLALSK